MGKLLGVFLGGVLFVWGAFGMFGVWMVTGAGDLGEANGLQEIQSVESELVSWDFEKAHAQAATGARVPSCLDNYQSWASSGNYKTDVSWSTWFVSPFTLPSYSGGGRLYNNFERDLNGDGLVDYVFIYPKNQYERQDCVFLSNGEGWDLVYRCVVENNGTTSTFYGDCADV